MHVLMRWPARVLFGRGVLARLPDELPPLRVQRALIVTDRGVRRAGLTLPIEDVLRGRNIACEVFDGVDPDPPIENVIAGAQQAHEGAFDTVIGIGGGSAMDTAKAISALAVPGRTLGDLYGEGRVPGPGLTKILVPTTGGSGSEISDSCNFTDTGAGEVKRIIISRHLLADLALVDPALSDHAPPLVTAESGIDAVTHALEAFTCVSTSDFADPWCRQALALAARSLRRACREGAAAPEAREDMALAAMLGNAAADLAGLGAVHGMTHALTSRYPISHGRSNAILLPLVAAFNLPTRERRFAEIAALFGTGAEEHAPQALSRLTSDIGLSGRLSEFGVTPEGVVETARIALERYPRYFTSNPRPMTVADARAIYEAAL